MLRTGQQKSNLREGIEVTRRSSCVQRFDISLPRVCGSLPGHVVWPRRHGQTQRFCTAFASCRYSAFCVGNKFDLVWQTIALTLLCKWGRWAWFIGAVSVTVFGWCRLPRRQHGCPWQRYVFPFSLVITTRTIKIPSTVNGRRL